MPEAPSGRADAKPFARPDRSPGVGVAGTFHPAGPDRLREAIEGCFDHELGPGGMPETAADGPRRLAGLVVPHAGYRYSGPVAAHAYAALAGDGVPGTIVVVGPDHRGRGPPVASTDTLETPLGEPAIDGAFLEALGRLAEPAPSVHAREHSVLVQVPFLQVVAPDARLVPLVMADQSEGTARKLGEQIAAAARELDRDLLVVASTDLSHVGPRYGQRPPEDRSAHAFASERDARVLEAIEALDAAGMYRRIREDRINVCGCGAVGALLSHLEATDLDAEAARLAYATTHDVEPDRGLAVGYAAVRFDR